MTGKWDIKLLCGPDPAEDGMHTNYLNKGPRHQALCYRQGGHEAQENNVMESYQCHSQDLTPDHAFSTHCCFLRDS